ncbi:MAG: GNAT family N-acetyltransferase [Promethearchaeota archaeon]
MFSIIRASQKLMPEVVKILNSTYFLFKDLFTDPADLQEHHVDEAWIAQNFPIREFFLARVDGEYVGFISYQNLKSYAYIGYLYIRKGFFRRGFGRNLMHFVEMRAKLDKLPEIWLFVHNKAEWARQAYNRMGFEVMATTAEEIFVIDEKLKEYYETGNVLVRKIISPLNQDK